MTQTWQVGLSDRECETIRLRCGLGRGGIYKLEDVARFFHVTRERVRQIEQKAAEKLQDRYGGKWRAIILRQATGEDVTGNIFADWLEENGFGEAAAALRKAFPFAEEVPHGG